MNKPYYSVQEFIMDRSFLPNLSWASSYPNQRWKRALADDPLMLAMMTMVRNSYFKNIEKNDRSTQLIHKMT